VAAIIVIMQDLYLYHIFNQILQMDAENDANKRELTIKENSTKLLVSESSRLKKRVPSFDSVSKYLQNACANYSMDDIDDSDTWSLKSFNSSYSENECSSKYSDKVKFSLDEQSHYENTYERSINIKNNEIHRSPEIETAKLKYLKKNKYNILQWLSKTNYAAINEDNTDKVNSLTVTNSCTGVANFNVNDDNLPNLLKPKKEPVLRDVNAWAPSCY